MKIIFAFLIIFSSLMFSQNQIKDNLRLKNKVTFNKQVLENGYLLVEQIHLWGSGSAWLNYQKINFIFDNNNQMVEKNIFSWDNSVWINYQREFYSYDNSGNDTMILKQDWVIDRWINADKIINVFDSENNLVQTTHQFFFDSLFVNWEKRSFLYNPQNNLTEEIYQLWVDENWENRTRSTRVYNSENSVVEIINEDWNEFEWRNNNQRIFEYDGNKNKTLEILSYWNGTDWINQSRLISNYNLNDLISELILDEYFDNTWLHLEKDIYSYNSLNLTEDRKLRWETFGWDTSSRINYLYNVDEKCIEQSFQSYHNSIWEDRTRYTFEYDEFGNLEIESSYTWVFTEWVNNHRFINSYSQLTNVESEQPELINNYNLQQNYPNPFNPRTKIRFTVPTVETHLPAGRQGRDASLLTTLKVYDILGNEVATLVNEYRNAGSYEVDFQSTIGSHQPAYRSGRLANGVYFYQLRVGDYVETKKMILLK